MRRLIGTEPQRARTRSSGRRSARNAVVYDGPRSSRACIGRVRVRGGAGVCASACLCKRASARACGGVHACARACDDTVEMNGRVHSRSRWPPPAPTRRQPRHHGVHVPIRGAGASPSLVMVRAHLRLPHIAWACTHISLSHSLVSEKGGAHTCIQKEIARARPRAHACTLHTPGYDAHARAHAPTRACAYATARTRTAHAPGQAARA